MHRWSLLALVLAASCGGGGGSTPPAAPSGLTATGGASIALTWTAVDKATSYVVQRGDAHDGPYAPVGTPTAASFTDSSVSAGTSYFYVVQAKNDTGTSGNSNEATGLTTPPAPAGVTVIASGNSEVVTWTAAKSATGYVVSRAAVAGGAYAQAGTPTATTYTDTALGAGTKYFYKVKAINASGAGPDSAETGDTTAPGAPAVTATGGTQSVTLSWPAVAGATGYAVKRSSTSGTGYTQIAAPATPGYTDAGLSDGATYYYVVVASNAAGSAQSAEASAITVPAMVGGVTATAGNAQVLVAWSAVSPAPTGYDVQKGASASGPFTSLGAPVTGTSTTVSGLANGVQVCFVVLALNGSGHGAASTAACATPIGPPAAPVLVATGGALSVSLTWTNVAATTYTVKRGASAGSETTLTTVSATSFNDTSLAAGTTYFYVVVADNGHGTAQSNEASAITAPAVPGGVTVTPADGQVTVAWSAAAGAARYDLLQGAATGGPFTALGLSNQTALSKVITAPNGTQVCFEVRAINAGGTTDSTPGVCATPQGPPASPVLTATGGNLSVALSWTDVSATYTIKRSLQSGTNYTTISTGSGTSYTDNGAVTAGTRFYYIVIADNGHGTSQSNEASAITLPAAPTGVQAVPGNGAVQVSWSAATGADSYDLSQGPTSGGTFTSLGQTITALTYNVTGLTNGTNVCFKVQAVNASGHGASSSVVCATPNAVPDAPTSFSGTAGNAQVVLTWGAPAGGASVTGYRVFRNGTQIGVDQPGTGYTDTAVVNDTSYDYYVLAYNAAGPGTHSNTLTLTPHAPMAAPVVTAVGLNNNGVKLSWAAVQRATAYDVFRATTSGAEGSTPFAAGVTAATYTDSTATNGTKVYYQVRATNSTEAPSALSAEVSATPAREICTASNYQNNPHVFALDADASGETPIRRTFGAGTLLFSPWSVAVDAAHSELATVDQVGSSLLIYPSTVVTGGSDTTPKRVIAGAATGLSFPVGVAIDSAAGEIFVVNQSSITVYDRTLSGNVAPKRTLAFSSFVATAMALDVTNHELFVSATDLVSVYNSTTLASKRQFFFTGGTGFSALSLDLAHSTIYVATNQSPPSIYGVARTGANDVSASHSTLTATGASPIYALALDATPDQLLASTSDHKILAYARTATGSTAAARTLDLGANAVSAGLALDGTTLWFSNFGAPTGLMAVAHNASGAWTAADGIYPASALAAVDVAADPAHDELWVASTSGSESAAAFPMTTLLKADAPARQLIGDGNAVAYDATDGEVYAVNTVAGQVEVFARSGTPATPLLTLNGFSNPTAVAFQGGDLFVSDDGGVNVFHRTAGPALTFTTTIAGGNTQLNAPGSLFVDATEILVANAGEVITVYPRSATGNASPTRVITDSSVQKTAITGLLKDASGKLFVLNYMSQPNHFLIEVFAAGATDPATPQRSFSAPATPYSAGGLAFCN